MFSLVGFVHAIVELRLTSAYKTYGKTKNRISYFESRAIVPDTVSQLSLCLLLYSTLVVLER